MKLTYKDAGVNKEAGYQQVQLIKSIVKETYTDGVVSDLGGFSGLFRPDFSTMKNPLLVSGTDGVGTKVELAFRANIHHTVGIDCVAMCVNDILCQGAQPLFFLDYIATGKLVPEKMADLVSGIAQGCKQAGAALIGGETAEMPGIYQEDHYDLAGFVVGMVDQDKLISKENVKVGDKIIGLKSSGLHSNGFSLVRKVIEGRDHNEFIPDLNKTLIEELLTPTKIYVKPVLELLESVTVHGISHITGGGFIENIPRALNENQRAQIDCSYEIPSIFNLIQQWGNIESLEMYNTFNMGIGLVLMVDQSDVDSVLEYFGSEAIVLGEVVEGELGVDLCNL